MKAAMAMLRVVMGVSVRVDALGPPKGALPEARPYIAPALDVSE